MLTIFKSIKFHGFQIFLLFIFILCCAFAQMLLPSLLSKMISLGVIAKQQNTIYTIGLIMIAITICSCIISYLSVKLSAKISTNFSAQLRSLVFKKIQSFSASEFDHFSVASLITRSTSDIMNVQTFLAMLLRIGLLAPMMAIAGLLFSASTGGKVSVVLLFAIPILLVSLGLIILFASRYSIVLRKKLDHINHLFLESLEGVRVIRAFNKQAKECERFEHSNHDYAKTQLCAGRISSLLMPTISVIFGVTTAAVLGLGSFYVQANAMEVSALVANSQYISMVLTSVMMLSLVIMMFPTSYACAKRISELLQTEPTIKDGSYPFHARPLRNTIEFKNVTFAYPNAKEALLQDISFISKPGEVTAIVGGTGRGKSSIVKLIPRLYDPLFGEILIDGVNIKEYKLDDLRSLIGYVPQKNVLFSGTIGDNLNFGNEHGTLHEWKQAASIACANEFIEQKELQYDHLVAQGGSNLSGGQKQRMAIARAIMKQPEVYVFDDSFSALDVKTDQSLRQKLKAHIKDATCIIIAQRISSILDADRILVVDDGRIIANGTHQELLKSCPLYQEIVELQLGKECDHHE